MSEKFNPKSVEKNGNVAVSVELILNQTTELENCLKRINHLIEKIENSNIKEPTKNSLIELVKEHKKVLEEPLDFEEKTKLFEIFIRNDEAIFHNLIHG